MIKFSAQIVGYLLNVFLMVSIITSCENTRQSDIYNEITLDHINIPGTKASIIPPSDFVVSSGFSGLEELASGSSIMIVEIPSDYDQLIIEINPERLSMQGVIEKTREDFLFNTFNATLIHAEQSTFFGSFFKTILLFGDDSLTVMITGVSPQNMPELKDRIEHSILSAVFDTKMDINKEEALGFELELLNSKFQFAEMLILSAIYTVDGKLPTESNDKSNILVSKSFSKVNIEDPKIFALQRLEQLPSINNSEPDEIQDIYIDNMHGYEITSYQQNENTGTIELVYQVMLFNGLEYFIIVGHAEKDFESNLDEFKKAANTFKRK